MNIPNMTARKYKNYEREIGPVLKLVAQESCSKACDKERNLTLKN